MTNIELLILSIGICTDSFVISICKGVISKNKKLTCIKCASSFTFFQVLFILLGFFFGGILNRFLDGIENLIVFLIFFILGINIFKEGFESDKEDKNESILSYILLGISSSIDSLSVGLSFALYGEKILTLILFVIPFTIIFSILGVLLGNFVGNKYKKITCIISSIILLYFGFKFLVLWKYQFYNINHWKIIFLVLNYAWWKKWKQNY